ncbi:MAG: hypothetical protein LBQ86_07160, partial [Holophagales bacterium]|nr:hypothetical protein [Holophagales bacterium]
PDFQITVAVKDPKSKLFINGQERNSGQVTSVALNREGDTTIPIQVIAEDGKNFNVVSVTTKTMDINTKVVIADSMAGNLLDNARITIRDSKSKELLAKDIILPMSAQGTEFLGLEKGKLYDIYARTDDTSEGCVVAFDPSREDTLRIYSRTDWIRDLPASAPIITDVSWAPVPSTGYLADCDWRTLPAGVNVIKEDTPLNMYVLSVIAMAESEVGGYRYDHGSLMVNIDDIASYDQGSYIPPLGYYRYFKEPVVVDGRRYLKTEIVWNMSSYVSEGSHFLDIVVSDWANNRTDKKIYLDLGTTANATDRDFTAFYPDWYAIRSYTTGVNQHLYSREPAEGGGDMPSAPSLDSLYFRGPAEDGGDMPFAPSLSSPNTVLPDPVGPEGDTIYVYFETDFRESYPSGTTISGFRSYELERAINANGPFELVRKQDYSYLYSSYYHSGYDYSPELVGGGTYYYRMRYWNNAGYSQWSPVKAITIMPSFRTNLVSPAHNAVSSTLWPTFRFRAHEALLDPAGSDYGRFLLFIKDKEGYPVVSARFEVDFRVMTDGKPLIRIYWGGQWLDISQKPDGTPVESFVKIEPGGIIAIDTKLANDNFSDQFTLFTLYPGVPYEWNIFGDRSGYTANWTYTLTDGAYFYKSQGPNYQGYTGYNYSYSYGSTPDEGSGAANGYFTLIISPSAN